MLLIPAAQALPVFDSWSVSSGTITVTCPSGFTCETVSEGDGFKQVQWTDNTTNDTFIQTIITDQNASGDPPGGGTPVPYSDESFIQLGNVNGIMSKQHSLQEDVDSGTSTVIASFETTSDIRTGWANTAPDASNPNMAVTQTFSNEGDATVTGDEFDSNFSVKIIHDSSGAVQDRSMSIDQTAGLGDGSTDSTDAQRYVLEQRKGAFTTTASDMTLDASSFDSTGAALNGGTVDWASGDEVMLRWIGQRVNTGSQGVSVFGFEGITNAASTTGQTEATTFSTTSTGIVADSTDPQGYVSPFDWDSTFGTTPPTLP